MDDIKFLHKVSKRFMSQVKFAILRTTDKTLPFLVSIPKDPVTVDVILRRRDIWFRHLQSDFEDVLEEKYHFKLLDGGDKWLIKVDRRS